MSHMTVAKSDRKLQRFHTISPATIKDVSETIISNYFQFMHI